MTSTCDNKRGKAETQSDAAIIYVAYAVGHILPNKKEVGTVIKIY